MQSKIFEPFSDSHWGEAVSVSYKILNALSPMQLLDVDWAIEMQFTTPKQMHIKGPAQICIFKDYLLGLGLSRGVALFDAVHTTITEATTSDIAEIHLSMLADSEITTLALQERSHVKPKTYNW